jgi:hypothetical protein
MLVRVLVLATLVAGPLHAAVTGRVVDEEGAPIAGARVRAFARQPLDVFYARALSDAPEPQPIATAAAATDGGFAIDAKQAAIADVVADAPGRRAAHAIVADGEDAGVLMLRKAEGRRGRVIAAGKPAAGARIVGRLFASHTDEGGFFELDAATDAAWVIHPGFALTPLLFNAPQTTLGSGVTLRGRVVAANGQAAVPNAIIYVDAWPLARSGEDGTFVIAHAPPRWRMLMAGDGQRVATTTRKSGDSYTMTLRPGATVSGVVRSSKSNAPVAGALVTIRQESDFGGQHSSVTDAKGNFTLARLPAGSHTLYAAHPSHTIQPTALRLVEGQRVHRDLEAAPVIRVSGIVLSEDRKPVAGAMVGLPFGRPSAWSGPDGRFTFRFDHQVPSGPRLAARKKGYAFGLSGPIDIDGAPNTTIVMPRGFELRLRAVDRSGNGLPDEPVRITRTDLEEFRSSMGVVVCGEPAWPCRTGADGTASVHLSDGTYNFTVGGGKAAMKDLLAQQITPKSSPLMVVLERGVEISGRVVYADGSPAIDGPVMVAVGGQHPQMNRPPLHTTANPDGSFVLTNVLPGRISVYARLISAEFVDADPIEVSAPASDVVLTVPKPVRIDGRVVEKATQQPVREFSLTIRRFRGAGFTSNTQSFASDDGTFVLDNLVEAKVDIMAVAPGFAPATVSNAASARTEPVTIALERGARVSVRVTAERRPVSGAQVTIGGMTRDAGPPPRPMQTDAEGVFVFDSLSAGEYVVTVAKQGYVSARKSIEAVVGKDAELDVDLTRGRIVRGKVLDKDGIPISGARVMIPGADSPSTRPVHSDSNGAFTLEGLPESPLNVSAEKSGYARGRAVIEPKSETVTITLQRGGTIQGRVTGLSEAEMAGVRVHAFAADVPAAHVDAAGNFILNGVSDGHITVAAMTTGRQHRTVEKAVEVINGSAPPVELEFTAGFTVRGRVTRGGAAVPMAGVNFAGRTFRSSGVTRVDGTYEVSVPEAGDYGVVIHSGPGVPFDAGRVTITGPTVHDIAIGGGALRGRVIDEVTGAPVSGAAVQVSRTAPRGPGTMVTTDSDGRFMLDPLSAGIYALRVNKQRYAPVLQSVEVTEGVPAEVDLRLRSGERTRLRVVDALDRRPLEGGSIHVIDAQKKSAHAGPVTLDGEGTLLLWLLPGRYTARISVTKYVPESVDFMVPGPETVVALRRGGRVVVRGMREGAVRARIRDAQTKRPVSTIGLPPGVFENIPPGSYDVELLDASQRVLASKPAMVNSGETFTVTFE